MQLEDGKVLAYRAKVRSPSNTTAATDNYPFDQVQIEYHSMVQGRDYL